MKLSNNWFARDIEPIFREHVVPFFERYRKASPGVALKYLEIGVCEGASLRWMIEAVGFDFSIGIDPYVAIRQRRRLLDAVAVARANADENLAGLVASGKLARIFASSGDVFANRAAYGLTGAAARFDCAYVDGDHRAPEALRDMVGAWDLLKVGGLMIVDDLQRRWHLGQPWVYEAFRAFSEVYEKRAAVLYRNKLSVGLIKQGDG